ncbi:hypothetical protein BH23CHL2_BH23CHL2_03920 [soil metagenome]
MLGRLRTAAKFFTIGLIAGIIFAPDSGARMRERIVSCVRGYIPGFRSEE